MRGKRVLIRRIKGAQHKRPGHQALQHRRTDALERLEAGLVSGKHVMSQRLHTTDTLIRMGEEANRLRRKLGIPEVV